MNNELRHNGLQCSIESIAFVQHGTVVMHFPASHCCDMRRAIVFAKSITRRMPSFGLWRIRTYSGGKPDIIYEKDDDGVWTAYSGRCYRKETP